MKNRFYLHSALRGLSLVWFPTFVLWLQSRYQLEMAEIYRLQALSLICALLFEVPAGLGADRWGRKKALLTGPLCFLASYLIFALGSSFMHALAASALSALGNACFSGVMGSALFESLKREKAASAYPRIMAKARLWHTTTSAVAMASCGWINGALGQQAGFFIAAGVSAAMLLNLLNIKTASPGSEIKLTTKHVFLELKGVLRQPKVISLMLVGLAAASQERLYMLILNPIWTKHGIAPKWFGLLTAGQAALATLVVVLLTKRFKFHRSIPVLCLMTSLCLYAMSATSDGTVAVILPFATHVLLAVVGISCYSNLQSLAPSAVRSTFMSVVVWGEMLGAAMFFAIGARLAEGNDVLLLSQILVGATVVILLIGGMDQLAFLRSIRKMRTTLVHAINVGRSSL